MRALHETPWGKIYDAPWVRFTLDCADTAKRGWLNTETVVAAERDENDHWVVLTRGSGVFHVAPADGAVIGAIVAADGS